MFEVGQKYKTNTTSGDPDCIVEIIKVNSSSVLLKRVDDTMVHDVTFDNMIYWMNRNQLIKVDYLKPIEALQKHKLI